MISNLWESIELYCSNHNQDVGKMELEQAGKMLSYVCPKCHSSNCNDDERLCTNKVSVRDFEKILTHLDKLLTEALLNDEELNLTNYCWSNSPLKFLVIEHGEKIKINVRSPIIKK